MSEAEKMNMLNSFFSAGVAQGQAQYDQRFIAAVAVLHGLLVGRWAEAAQDRNEWHATQAVQLADLLLTKLAESDK